MDDDASGLPPADPAGMTNGMGWTYRWTDGPPRAHSERSPCACACACHPAHQPAEPGARPHWARALPPSLGVWRAAVAASPDVQLQA